MDYKTAATSDALEALHISQSAIRAALKELSLWVSQRGWTHIHYNLMTALQTHDTNADAVTSAIDRIRS
nr:hypothetical protein [Pseudomonas cremoricolorata]